MKIFNKSTYRILGKCFQDRFPYSRAIDNRTPEQIKNTMQTLLRKNPEIQEFTNDLMQMSPKYMGIATDILELSKQRSLSFIDINLGKVKYTTGNTFLKELGKRLPEIAKTNPYALETIQEVINNTDTITSKHFILGLFDEFMNPATGKKFKAIKPFVKDVADTFISDEGIRFIAMGRTKFITRMKMFVSPQAKLTNLKRLYQIRETMKKSPNKCFSFDMKRFLNSNIPEETFQKNLKEFSSRKEVPDLADVLMKS